MDWECVWHALSSSVFFLFFSVFFQYFSGFRCIIFFCFFPVSFLSIFLGLGENVCDMHFLLQYFSGFRWIENVCDMHYLLLVFSCFFSSIFLGLGGLRMCVTFSIGASVATEHCCMPCQALIAKIKIYYLLLSILKEFIHGLGWNTLPWTLAIYFHLTLACIRVHMKNI